MTDETQPSSTVTSPEPSPPPTCSACGAPVDPGLNRCPQCKTDPNTGDAPPDEGLKWTIALGLGAVFLLGYCGVAMRNNAHPPSAANEPVAAAGQSQVAKRQAAQNWWQASARPLALSFGLAAVAIQIFGQADTWDPIEASKTLKQAADAANLAWQRAAGLNAGKREPLPDGWTDVQRNVQESAATLESACKKLREIFDDPRPSTVVEAQERYDAAVSGAHDAVTTARRHYVEMGGRANDVSDFGLPSP